MAGISGGAGRQRSPFLPGDDTRLYLCGVLNDVSGVTYLTAAPTILLDLLRVTPLFTLAFHHARDVWLPGGRHGGGRWHPVWAARIAGYRRCAVAFRRLRIRRSAVFRCSIAPPRLPAGRRALISRVGTITSSSLLRHGLRVLRQARRSGACSVLRRIAWFALCVMAPSTSTLRGNRAVRRGTQRRRAWRHGASRPRAGGRKQAAKPVCRALHGVETRAGCAKAACPRSARTHMVRKLARLRQRRRAGVWRRSLLRSARALVRKALILPRGGRRGATLGLRGGHCIAPRRSLRATRDAV